VEVLQIKGAAQTHNTTLPDKPTKQTSGQEFIRGKTAINPTVSFPGPSPSYRAELQRIFGSV